MTLTAWPDHGGLEDAASETEIGWVVELISEIRSLRTEMGVPGALQIPLVMVGADAGARARAEKWRDTLIRLARLSGVSFADASPPGSAQILVRGTTAVLPLEGIVDLGAEKARLTREIEKLKGEVAKVDAKLGNADFVARAPEEVVEEQQDRRAEALGRIEKMEGAVSRLKG